MNAELTHFLGRKPYERKEDEANYRSGSYGRNFPRSARQTEN